MIRKMLKQILAPVVREIIQGDDVHNKKDAVEDVRFTCVMLPHGEQKALATEVGVSRITLWRALTGRADNPLARLLRKAAVERGGVEYDPARRARVGEREQQIN